jgi:glycosyltransferase involved in cell wall biosynthesis
MINPLVSILMPAFNCELYIHQAISSILQQTYTNLELIICDDGSTDLTWDVINSFSDTRIRKFQHESNLGYLKTYNFLMTQVQGHYFTFQDADDWSIETRIQLQLDIFENYKDVQICACNGSFYYSEQIQISCPSFDSDYIRLTEGNFHFMLPSVMYKKEILQRFNKFNSFFDKTTGGDQYFILEVLSRFKGYAINEYLYIARFNPTSNHRTLTSHRKLAASDLYFFLKKQRVTRGSDWLSEGRQDLLLEYEKKLLSDRRFLAEKYREYAVYRLDSNEIGPGFKLIVSSLCQWPFHTSTYRTIFYGIRQGLRIK